MRVIAWITAPALLAVLRKIKVRGTFEIAHRAKQRCGQVFHYAIAIAQRAVPCTTLPPTCAGRWRPW
jgi:hypothetical protein